MTLNLKKIDIFCDSRILQLNYFSISLFKNFKGTLFITTGYDLMNYNLKGLSKCLILTTFRNQKLILNFDIDIDVMSRKVSRKVLARRIFSSTSISGTLPINLSSVLVENMDALKASRNENSFLSQMQQETDTSCFDKTSLFPI